MKFRIIHNQKGFSLIELIIVITIMAALIGIVASRALPFIERTREAKDQQQLSTITTAMVTSISESEEIVGNFGPIPFKEGSGAGFVNDDTGGTNTEFMTHMRELLNCRSLDSYATDLKARYRSKAYSNLEIYIEYQGGKATAFMSHDKTMPADDKLMAESE